MGGDLRNRSRNYNSTIKTALAKIKSIFDLYLDKQEAEYRLVLENDKLSRLGMSDVLFSKLY